MYCLYCGCSEFDACILDNGVPCSWASTDPPVCSAPDCVDVHRNGPAIVTQGDDIAEAMRLEQDRG
jgi:hypothetical protein